MLLTVKSIYLPFTQLLRARECAKTRFILRVVYAVHRGARQVYLPRANELLIRNSYGTQYSLSVLMNLEMISPIFDLNVLPHDVHLYKTLYEGCTLTLWST